MRTRLTIFAHRRTRRTAPLLTLHFLLAATTVAATLVPAEHAFGARRTDKREIEARHAFAAGRYEEALNLYADLYADKVHPTYLRNIGRCYQNLKQPEKAINAFRDYLRQAKRLRKAERTEIEGYIAEMEKLQSEQEEAAKLAAQPEPEPEPEPVTPVPPPTNPEPVDNGLQLTQPLPPPPPPQPTPIYKKAWFWGVVGTVVAAGVVGGLYAGGVFDSKSSIPCTAVDGCY